MGWLSEKKRAESARQWENLTGGQHVLEGAWNDHDTPLRAGSVNKCLSLTGRHTPNPWLIRGVRTVLGFFAETTTIAAPTLVLVRQVMSLCCIITS